MKSLHYYLLLILVPYLATCQETKQLTTLQKSKLDSIATKDVPKGAPGVAVGIVMDGKIVYEKYAGYANLKDSTSINKRSRFNIASNGKQFTALAILSLIEDNKLNLDDDIRTFFPELYPKIKFKIKIAHLLNHTSGIRDVYDLWSLQSITWWKHTYRMEDALSLLSKQIDLNFDPGEKYSYSNSNYIILAEIIEKVSGTTFIEYTNQMFHDLNMPNTSFISNHKTIKEPIAQPYFNFNTWTGYNWIWNIYGDGNIFSTLEDQLNWEQILQTKQNKRFSKAFLEKSQSLLPNTKNTTYGYGLEFGEHQNISYKFHGGSTGAWKAITARFPGQNFSIITLTNSGKTDPMMQTLNSADVLMGIKSDSENIRLTPEKIGPYISLKEIVGLYQLNDAVWQFVEKEGELYLVRSGRNDTKLIREADNVFQQWNDAPFKQEFTKNEKGEMEITAYYTRTKPFTLIKKNTNFSDFDFKSVNGTFLNKETEVDFSIKYVSGVNYKVKSGKTKMKAILLSPTELVINDYNYKITIKKDENSTISHLLLTSDRIQNVKFSKIK
ncbi:serine hydrolase domain-containing protein [uncultured Aquimarina sp.]|uniref:serine hydrolase domain-containing protein n=1 Tax=uncultured Aquimarina sp. TaxID=575652 RepID=UPI00260A576C|nr:serine hydrolase domain-containing protein [uncultured Aquimarina sp.]